MHLNYNQVQYAVVGPTASGKGHLARALAGQLDAELLSVDSMKVYQGMDIGTAKPTAENRKSTTYHLLDLVKPTEAFHVAEYLNAAAIAEKEIQTRGRLALYVGGTALYLKALRYGLFAGPDRDVEYRKELETLAGQKGNAALHLMLEKADPEAASLLHPNDRKRVIRALEVVKVTGKPISCHQTQFKGKGRPARWIGLRWPRDDLNHRIDVRVDRMMKAGFLEEVKQLVANGGFGPTSGAGIGYAELHAHVRGEMSLEEAIEVTKMRTRRFSKRQATWFRSFKDIHWLDMKAGDEPESRVQDAREFLASTA